MAWQEHMLDNTPRDTDLISFNKQKSFTACKKADDYHFKLIFYFLPPSLSNQH